MIHMKLKKKRILGEVQRRSLSMEESSTPPAMSNTASLGNISLSIERSDKKSIPGSASSPSMQFSESTPTLSQQQSLFFSASGPSPTVRKKKSSLLLPLMATPSGASFKGPTFDYNSDDVPTIVRYLVDLFICEQKAQVSYFFCAFSNFNIDKVALFLHMKQFFEENGLEKDVDSNHKTTARQAISYLLMIWMALSSALYDLQFKKLFLTVVEFVRLNSDPSLNPLRLMLIQGKSKSKMDSELPLIRSITMESLNLAQTTEDNGFEPQLFCKGKTVLEVANTLTFSMFRVFKSIGPAELHDGAWQGKNKATTAPHLHALSLLFNRVAFLCVVEILYAATDELRANALLKCIELAMTLERMNNFEGMAAITSVFSAAPIQRLAPTWSAVGPKMSKKAKKLQELLQPVKNYKAYHNVFNSREAPILPWLAPKLRELRFMYDGNSIENEDKTINYDFLAMLGKTIHNHLKFKDTEFVFKDEEGNRVKMKEDLVTILEDVLTLDETFVEDTLYEKSLSIYKKKK